jgi:hypothetical protein
MRYPSGLLILVLRLTLPSTRWLEGSATVIGRETTFAARVTLFFLPLAADGPGWVWLIWNSKADGPEDCGPCVPPSKIKDLLHSIETSCTDSVDSWWARFAQLLASTISGQSCSPIAWRQGRHNTITGIIFGLIAPPFSYDSGLKIIWETARLR